MSSICSSPAVSSSVIVALTWFTETCIKNKDKQRNNLSCQNSINIVNLSLTKSTKGGREKARGGGRQKIQSVRNEEGNQTAVPLSETRLSQMSLTRVFFRVMMVLFRLFSMLMMSSVTEVTWRWNLDSWAWWFSRSDANILWQARWISSQIKDPHGRKSTSLLNVQYCAGSQVSTNQPHYLLFWTLRSFLFDIRVQPLKI